MRNINMPEKISKRIPQGMWEFKPDKLIKEWGYQHRCSFRSHLNERTCIDEMVALSFKGGRMSGNKRCPVIDTYWQTETGGFVISPSSNLGIGLLKPGSATLPMPGIEPIILDENGEEVGINEKGYICIKKPWPGLMLTIHEDPERYKSVYFSSIFSSRASISDFLSSVKVTICVLF